MADYSMIKDKDGTIRGMWIKELADSPFELCFMVRIGSGWSDDVKIKKIEENILKNNYTIKNNNLNTAGGYIIWFGESTQENKINQSTNSVSESKMSELENQYDIDKFIKFSKINDILGISSQKFIVIELKIYEIRSRSLNARDMISKVFPEKIERYKGSTGFQIMMIVMIEEFGSQFMKSQMMSYVDSVGDLFDIDNDTFFANKLIITQLIKTSKDFSELIKKVREFETKDESDCECFTCGVILGNIITAKMIEGKQLNDF